MMADRTSSIEIEGLSDLQAALRELPDATAKSVLRRVGREALRPVADRARANAREDTGALKASIGVSTKLTRRQRRANAKRDRDDVEIYAGAGGLTQAITEEFGTEDHAPHPFLRPAWDAEKQGVVDGLAKALGAEITKSAARIARKKAGGR